MVTAYRKLTTALCLVVMMVMALPCSVMAQSGDEKEVRFTSTNATMEDDPKQGVYNITIFSPDGAWKMQLNYHSDSMFGTFTNDDFRLSGDGKNYNYARNPKNDMVFDSFTDMNVKVSDEGRLYRVKANCLTNNRTRFIVEATIEAPVPAETRTDDLGYARLEENPFYGTWAIYAENENYRLGYGVVSTDILGTFYRADILMPELYDKKAGEQVKVTYATAVHTQDGDNTLFHIDIISEDHVQYSLDMFHGPYSVEVTEEKDILLGGMSEQDLTEMYGCYQFGCNDSEWGMAIAVKPEVLQAGKTTWTKDDLIMQYTSLMTMADMKPVDIFDIRVLMTREEESLALKADVTGMDGVLYHVTMLSRDVAPVATDTVSIDFGHVAVIDYSKGLGTVGIGAVKQGRYQLRCYLYGHKLEGEYSNEEAILDMSDIMVVDQERGTYVFHDAKYLTAKMEPEDGTTYITIDMVGVDDILYHATMYVDELTCMHDMALNVDMSETQMVALQEFNDGQEAEYTLQLQNMQGVYDKDYNIVGDGFALSFYFSHTGTAAVAGEYGYSAGTLAGDEYHTFFEKGCEVRVGPVAGTLTLEPIQQVNLKIGFAIVITYLYKIKAEFVGQNGALYSAEGSNYLLCIDADESFISMDESEYNSLSEALAEEGYRVRKVLKGGRLIIEKDGGEYDLQGWKTE